jgi:hypothetical protein
MSDYREFTRQYIYRMKLYDLFNRTLYVKWQQLQEDSRELGLFYILKNQIFNPQSVKEIEQAQIQIIPVNTPDEKETFRALYKFTSSNLSNGAPGNMIAYLVKDGTSGKYMGLIRQQSLPSPNLSALDNQIGWSRDWRLTGGKLQHVYNGQTLVAFKPFSYNCCGGKLLARLLVTDYFRENWFNKCGCLPVGAFTTSLYGSEDRLTQYDNLKGWMSLGQTVGRSPLPLPTNLFQKWRNDYDIKVPSIEEGGRADRAKRAVANVIIKETEITNGLFEFRNQKGRLLVSVLFKHEFISMWQD